MRDLLQSRGREALERLAGGRSLLAFDYDGVLAPLVTDPGGARMRRSTKRLLGQLSKVWPVAAVSGRAYDHTLRLTEGAVHIVVGNHGYELGEARPVPKIVLAQVAGWRAALLAELGAMEVFVEDKRSTLSVHYGLERRWREAEKAVLAAAAKLPNARIIRGKKVLNVLPERFPDKGDAVVALLRREKLESALYAGDDVTDEDAFALGPPVVLGVRVGPGPSAAEYRLRDQGAVDELLELLVELRSRRAARTLTR